MKLSEVSNILPSGLSVKGVTLLEKHPKFGGGFVDIFRASYRGNEVALKRMRVFQRGDELQSINRVACLTATHFGTIIDVLHNFLEVLSRGIAVATTSTSVRHTVPWHRFEDVPVLFVHGIAVDAAWHNYQTSGGYR